MIGPIWQEKAGAPKGTLTGSVSGAGEAIETHCGGKASSSKCPRLSLIPQEAMLRLASRFELGLKNHGDRAWNAQSGNQEILIDLDFLAVRIDHAMNHLMILSQKVAAAKRSGEFVMGDDDSAAVLFFGAFACCATKVIEERQELHRSCDEALVGPMDEFREDQEDIAAGREALKEPGRAPLTEIENRMGIA